MYMMMRLPRQRDEVHEQKPRQSSRAHRIGTRKQTLLYMCILFAQTNANSDANMHERRVCACACACAQAASRNSETNLAVVKGALDSDAVDVGVEHARHLQLRQHKCVTRPLVQRKP